MKVWEPVPEKNKPSNTEDRYGLSVRVYGNINKSNCHSIAEISLISLLNTNVVVIPGEALISLLNTNVVVIPGEASKSVRPSKGCYGLILKDRSDYFFSSESLNCPRPEEKGFIKNNRRTMEKSVVKVTESGSKNHESSDWFILYLELKKAENVLFKQYKHSKSSVTFRTWMYLF